MHRIICVVFLCIAFVWVLTRRTAEPFLHSAPAVSGDMDLVIVSNHFAEDLSWLEKSSKPVVVCSKTSPSPLCFQDKNRGREATAYLKFIVDNYDNLPKHVAFIHGHETAWHQRSKVDLIKNIEECALYQQYGYVSLNNTYIYDNRELHENKTMQRLQRVWDELFAPYLNRPPPSYVLHDCCAQFIVSRENILRLPRAAYAHWYKYIMFDDPYDDEGHNIGLLFEYMWHIIFGEPDVVHQPAYHRRFACGV